MILPAFPDVRKIKSRGPTAKLYLALQQPGGLTIDELRYATWGKDKSKLRTSFTIYALIRRLDEQLEEHGITITRSVNDHLYRMVAR